VSPYHMVTERPVRKLSKGSKGTHMHIVDCGGSGGGVVSVCGVYVSLSVCIYMFFFIRCGGYDKIWKVECWGVLKSGGGDDRGELIMGAVDAAV